MIYPPFICSGVVEMRTFTCHVYTVLRSTSPRQKCCSSYYYWILFAFFWKTI